MKGALIFAACLVGAGLGIFAHGFPVGAFWPFIASTLIGAGLGIAVATTAVWLDRRNRP